MLFFTYTFMNFPCFYPTLVLFLYQKQYKFFPLLTHPSQTEDSQLQGGFPFWDEE